MADKGHSIINTEGDAYLEYSDFYDFSSTYPGADNNMGEEGEEKVLPDHKLWVSWLNLLEL